MKFIMLNESQVSRTALHTIRLGINWVLRVRELATVKHTEISLPMIRGPCLLLATLEWE